MKPCPISLETLLNFRERRLAPEETAQLERHLAQGCSACSASLKQLEGLTALLSESAFESPSAQALNDAGSLLARRRPRAPLVEWIARLVPPAPSGLVPAMVRNLGAEPLQLLFETKEHDVDLWAEPNPLGSYYVIGQVRSRKTGASEPVTFVRLIPLTDPDAEHVVFPSSAGEFHLPELPAGRYTMTIWFTAGLLRLEELSLPEPA